MRYHKLSTHPRTIVNHVSLPVPMGQETSIPAAQAAIEDCQGTPSAFVYTARATALVTLGWDAETVANALIQTLVDNGYLALQGSQGDTMSRSAFAYVLLGVEMKESDLKDAEGRFTDNFRKLCQTQWGVDSDANLDAIFNVEAPGLLGFFHIGIPHVRVFGRVLTAIGEDEMEGKGLYVKTAEEAERIYPMAQKIREALEEAGIPSPKVRLFVKMSIC